VRAMKEVHARHVKGARRPHLVAVLSQGRAQRVCGCERHQEQRRRHGWALCHMLGR
jgi:hypothetical protein